MAVRLNINADVRGQRQVDQLNRSVNRLGRAAGTAATRFAGLEAAAARGRASFAALATTLNVGLVAGFAAVGFGINRFIRDTFDAGNLVEGLAIRFQLLFGSVAEGGRAFDELNSFAARVPFSLEDIAAASGNLAVVSKDADELANVLEITGNVAAATGLDFRQTAEQIQRAFAGGIAAADVFRERGVRSMLGFQSGVTVSVEETVEAFQRVFGAGGQFGIATSLLAETLQGQVSLVQDAYFQFRRVVQEQFFSFLTDQIRNLVGDFKDNDTALRALATSVGERLRSAFVNIEAAGRFVVANFERISAAIQAIIAFKFAGILAGMVAALAHMVIGLRAAATGATLFGTALRLNPIGAIITAIQLAVGAFFLFRTEIENISRVTLGFFSAQLTKLEDTLISFVQLFNKLPGINIELMTSSQLAAAAIINQADQIAILNDELEASLEATNNQIAAQKELDSINAQIAAANDNRVIIREDVAARVAARKAELTEIIEANKAILERNTLTGEISKMEEAILRIKTEILTLEKNTGIEVTRTAEAILASRQASGETLTNREKELDALIESNALIIGRNDLTMELSQTELDILRIKQEILQLERETGFVINRNANEILRSREELENSVDEATNLRERLENIGITSGLIGNNIADTWITGLKEGARLGEIISNTFRNILQTIADTIIRQTINLGIERLFERLGRQKVNNERDLNTEKAKGLALSRAQALFGNTSGSASSSGFFSSISSFFKFNQGGTVPGGAPYTDRVPALLTPGERVIPRGQVNSSGNGTTSNITNINISGNVDQRSINQIRSIISSSPGQVGGANRDYSRNTAGLKSRRK